MSAAQERMTLREAVAREFAFGGDPVEADYRDAEIAVRATVAWLREQGGADGDHGSSPALRAVAERIEESA